MKEVRGELSGCGFLSFLLSREGASLPLLQMKWTLFGPQATTTEDSVPSSPGFGDESFLNDVAIVCITCT